MKELRYWTNDELKKILKTSKTRWEYELILKNILFVNWYYVWVWMAEETIKKIFLWQR